MGVVGVLGTKPRFSTRAESALNYSAITAPLGCLALKSWLVEGFGEHWEWLSLLGRAWRTSPGENCFRYGRMGEVFS